MKPVVYHRLLLAVSLSASATTPYAADQSFSGLLEKNGAFVDANYQFFSFKTDGNTPVTLQTTSYGQNGELAGGFDPYLTLFRSSGRVIGQNDDKHPGVADSYLAGGLLNPGTYWVALTQAINPVNGNYYDPNSTNSGFTQSGDFTSVYGCTNGSFCNYLGQNRLPNWTVDLLGVLSANQENAGFNPPPAPDPAIPTPNIDTAQPFYLASGLGDTVNPVFQGGTLRVDAAGTYRQNFTINNQIGILDGFGNASVFTGVFSDATPGTLGALTIANSGTGGSVTLTGVNTYTGQTTINSGATLALTGAGSIASSSGLVGNGTFDIGGTAAGASLRTLSGNGTVNVGAQTLTLIQATGSFSGVIDGTGGLTVSGGTETLIGANTYTGGTTINPGATLQLGNGGTSGSIVGNVVDNGSLIFNRSDAVNFGSTVSGTGGLTQAGTGVLTLTANNTYTGNTTINPGATLQLGNGGTSGSIVGNVGDNGSLVFNRSNAVNFGGTVSGTGGLTQAGTGVLTLTANNTYTGNTTVNPGATLQLGNGGTSGSILGNVVDNGSLIFNRSDALNFGGTISGTGGLSQVGTGVLTLTANNTYTGNTTINPGTTLQLGNGGTSGGIVGNVINNGSLIFNRSDVVTYGASINGSGTLTQAGSGTLNLTGIDTLGGGTFVQQGILAVNGTLNSSVTVANGGTLKGTGLINSPVNVSGTLAPGNSPGTLTTNGTVTMNGGSTFKAFIDGTGIGNGSGNYSRLVITGAGNQFVNNGSALDLSLTYTPKQGDRFNLVSAQGGTTGTFSSINAPGLPSGLKLKTFNDGNGVELFATPTSYLTSLSLSGANYNAQSVGKSLNRLTALSDAGWSTQRQEQLLYSVAGLNAFQLPRVATALAGEVHGAMAASSPDAGRWLQTALARQLATSAKAGEDAAIKPGDNLWFDFNASQGHADGGGYASGYGYSRYQFAIGGDILHSQANRFGVGVTYASTSVSPNSGSGTLEETAPFVYGQYAFGTERRVIADALFAYGFTTWKTERGNPLYATGPLKANGSGSNIAWGAGVRSPFEFGEFTVEPFVRVLWQNSSRGGVSEGLSPSALSLSQYSLNGTRLLVGAAFGSGQRDPLAATLTYRASLAFGNDFGNLIYPTVTASLAGDSFQINSPHVGRQFAQLNLSGTYQIVDNAYAYVGLNGEARQNRLDGSVNAGFNLKF